MQILDPQLWFKQYLIFFCIQYLCKFYARRIFANLQITKLQRANHQTVCHMSFWSFTTVFDLHVLCNWFHLKYLLSTSIPLVCLFSCNWFCWLIMGILPTLHCTLLLCWQTIFVYTFSFRRGAQTCGQKKYSSPQRRREGTLAIQRSGVRVRHLSRRSGATFSVL